MQEEKKDIVVKPMAPMVQPAVSAEEALLQFRAFEDIKNRCLSSDDTAVISGNKYIKKTGWRKIKTIFNLREEILSGKRITDPDGSIRWIYRVRLSAPNGAFTDAEAGSSSIEDFAWADKTHTTKKPENALMAMAQTRAINRAISDLVGGGDVSAEEIGTVSPIPSGASISPDKMGARIHCAKCGKEVSPKVADFSAKKYSEILCYDCQKKDPVTVKADVQEEIVT